MKSVFYSRNLEYSEIRKAIHTLASNYPFLRCESIGKSCGGRDIFCLSLGAQKDAVLYASAFHGSEHLTANITLCLIENICEALKTDGEICGLDARRAFYGRGLAFVPLVNPDGCEISIKGALGAGNMAERIKRLSGGDFEHWNANLRGVDINHNFDAGWKTLNALEKEEGIFGPSKTRFGGFAPRSEPETESLCNLCEKRDFRHALALHSQGEVIYWSWGNCTPPKSAKMAEIMAAQSGYTLEVPTGLAVGGGFKDWFIEHFCRPAFTIEIGKGQNPLPPENFAEYYSSVEEILVLSAIM